MALGILLVLVGIALIAALIDWRSRRHHRVPSGYDLNQKLPEPKLDSRDMGTG